ncbi:hypothetical protein HMPREF9607_02350 [Cutibacterium modestum HL044PA1]|uniref:Uncharacterized protein n=1 Tax=Cutibacterium modestum HL044PA1 TaxID=765109 RepID=A0ABN0C2V6_9ACTN|nr:hypothetical protein HMPREF9607_02350 [Cutibacterium modestum HL044PA1]
MDWWCCFVGVEIRDKRTWREVFDHGLDVCGGGRAEAAWR